MGGHFWGASLFKGPKGGHPPKTKFKLKMAVAQSIFKILRSSFLQIFLDILLVNR